MKKIAIVALSSAPYLAFAATGQGITSIVDMFGNIIASLIPILIALALLYFFWGLIKFITSSGDGKDQGKGIMIWGVIALFVMVSIWGIVGLLQESFGVQGGTVDPVEIPGFNR